MSTKHSSHKSSSRHSGSKQHSSASPSTSQSQPEGTWPPVTFLFIVNELPTNDDPEFEGSIPARRINGRWHPPDVLRGYFAQEPGYVYKWSNGTVTLAPNYTWTSRPVGAPSVYANGTIYGTDSTGATFWPEYYRAATVFYCNHFDKFFTTRGDAGTRDISRSDPEDGWQPLSFLHDNNISYVEHAGDQEFLAVRTADWLEELLPNTYRRHHTHGPAQGGLAGLLPLVIALIAFSCTREDLYTILAEDRAWRGNRWVRHNRPSGRIPKRGVVVTVFRDPENPQGSTEGTLQNLEDGPTPIFR